jgi:hypothetical protein
VINLKYKKEIQKGMIHSVHVPDGRRRFKRDSSCDTFLQGLERGAEEIFSATGNNPFVRKIKGLRWVVGIVACDLITTWSLAEDGVNTEETRSKSVR